MRFFKHLTIMILANLLVSCGGQFTHQGDANAQEPILPDIGEPTFIKLDVPDPNEFPSSQQEHFYKLLVAEIAQQRKQYKIAAHYYLDVAYKVKEIDIIKNAVQYALWSKQKNLALEAVKLWHDLDPNDAQAQRFLIRLLLQEGKQEEALKAFQKILDNLKNAPEQRKEQIVDFLRRQEDLKKMIVTAENLIALRPSDAVLLLTYARLLIRDDQLEKAAKIVNKILTVAPDHEEAVPLYAYILSREKDTQAALTWLANLLQKYPDHPEWREMYARMLTENEQYEAAIEQYEMLLQADKDDPETLYTLGIIYLHLDKFDLASQAFKQLIALNKRENTARFYLGEIAEDQQNLEEALQWYHQVDEGEDYLAAQARIALILSEKGQLQAAIDHLHQVTPADDEEALKLLQFEAELLIRQEHHAKAMALFNEAVAEYPNELDLRYNRAMLADTMEDLEQAEADLRYILEQDSEYIDALNGLGYILANKTKRYAEAYDLIQKALKLSPHTYYIIDSMGWVLYRLGRYNEAIDYLRRALKMQKDPEIAAHLGEVLWVTGKKEEAKAVWEDAKKDFPEADILLDTIQRFIKPETEK